MKHSFQLLLLAASTVLPMAAKGQQPADSAMLELQNLSAYEQASALQASLNSKMGVGSHIGLSSRETPGIVSVITAEEIRSTGARDFIDIMRLVPGFDFASDLDFAVGPTIRGNWAMEGKILLMVDGVRYNDLLFQSLLFGNHLPVDQIARVEIIRGPGSAIYGGTAEYGVINITTKGASGLNGLSASASYGTYQDAYARRNLGVSLGKRFGELMVDITAQSGQANRSDRHYLPMLEDAEPLDLLQGGRGQLSPTFLSTGLRYKGLSARFLYDDYSWNTPYLELQNKSINGTLQYEAKIGEFLTLSPQLSYTNQLPWHYKNILDAEMGDEYKVRAERTTASLTAGYRASRRLYLTLGGEWFSERATDLLEGGNFGDEPSVAYTNVALFGEGLLKHRLANLTAGLRAEHHSAFGFAMAPRFALTKHVNRWHFKGLASGAYRAPGIENINMNDAIRPERTTTFELETGYQFTKDQLFAVNLFSLRTKDVIVYSYDVETLEEFYENHDYMGSSGLEVIYQLRRPRWSANLSYSYSQASEKNTVEAYWVEENRRMNVGIAAHKASLHGGIRLLQGLSLNPSLVWIGERWGYARYDQEGDPLLERFAPLLLVNLNLQYQNLLPGLSLSLGVHNLLDHDNAFVQAYNGESSPVPGPGRELTLKASYDLKFKK
jgi:outer membrane receptor for ferrienterochelin and colicin